MMTSGNHGKTYECHCRSAVIFTDQSERELNQRCFELGLYSVYFSSFSIKSEWSVVTTVSIPVILWYKMLFSCPVSACLSLFMYDNDIWGPIAVWITNAHNKLVLGELLVPYISIQVYKNKTQRKERKPDRKHSRAATNSYFCLIIFLIVSFLNVKKNCTISNFQSPR